VGTGLGSHAFCPPYLVKPNITLTRTPKPAAARGVALSAMEEAGEWTAALTPLTCI
jgi:hypothetical protein